MAATIKDISLKAGVSYSTVSRALNNTGRMSSEIRKKILEIASELNYVPNYSARSLVMDKSYNIGVFAVQDKTQTDAFYEILEGVHDVVGLSFNIVFKKLENREDFDTVLKFKKYDGIVFFSSIKSDIAYIDLITQENVPIVVINRKMADKEFLNVVAEDFQGAYMATEHLIRLGHRKIAYVDGPTANVVETERLGGYLAALRKYDIPADDRYIIPSSGLPNNSFAATCNLLNMECRPTAIFAYSDPVALGVMSALRHRGLSVPGDMAVVGFDNMTFSQYLVPTLTSIEKPRTEMGRVAARMLLDVLEGRKPDHTKVSLQTKLIVRESCGAAQ